MEASEVFTTWVSPENRIWLQKYNGNDTKVIIPEGIQEIVATAFLNARDVTSIVLPESLLVLQNGAFNNCDALNEINIPEGMIAIEDRAFSSYSNIKGKTIKIGKNLKSIGITVYSRYSNISMVFSPFHEVEEYCVDDENEAFLSIDGVVYIKNDRYNTYNKGDMLMAYPQGKKDDEFVIPEGTRVIYDYAFRKNKHIQKIVIPESVELIGEGAFYECNQLREVVVNSSKVEWSKFVFYNDKDVVIKVMTDTFKGKELDQNVSIYSDVLPLSKYPKTQRERAIVEFGEEYAKSSNITQERKDIFSKYLKKQKSKLPPDVMTESVKRFIEEL